MPYKYYWIKLKFLYRQFAMATEGDPTDLIKVLHLLAISFTWGMQVWVSFIAGKDDVRSHWWNILERCWWIDDEWLNVFLIIKCSCSISLYLSGFVLVSQVTQHTFGLVQSKLFPVYFFCLLGGNFVNLAIYAVYHPRELLDWHEGVQVSIVGSDTMAEFQKQ